MIERRRFGQNVYLEVLVSVEEGWIEEAALVYRGTDEVCEGANPNDTVWRWGGQVVEQTAFAETLIQNQDR